MIEINNRFLLDVIQFALLLTCICTVVWIADKGIALPDEGLFYAYINPNVENYSSVMNYDLLFKLLFKYTSFEFNLWEGRILRIVLLIITGLSFWSIFKANQFVLYEKLFLFLTIFAGYGMMPQLISYYTLGFILAAFYFVIFWLSFKENKHVYFLYFLQGLICSASYLVKPTLGLMLYTFYSFFIIYFILIKKYIQFFTAVLIFHSSFWLFQFFLNLQFPHYSFTLVLQSGKDFTESANSYNFSYILLKLLSTLKWIFLLVISGFLLGVRIPARFERNYLIVIFKYILSVLIIFLFVFMHSSSNRFGFAEYSLSSVALIIQGYLFSKIDIRKMESHKLFLIFLLFILPLICQFGSNVYFFRINQYYAFFWWLLIMILIHEISFKFSVFPYINIFLSALILYNIYLNHIKYNMGSSDALNNFVEFTYDKSDKIMIPLQQKKYLNDLQLKFEKYTSNINHSYVLGLYQFPGDILFAGGKVFFNPCVWTKYNINSHMRYLHEHNKYAIIKEPMVITKDISIAKNDLSAWFDIKVLDSVKHFQQGSMYLLQTFRK